MSEFTQSSLNAFKTGFTSGTIQVSSLLWIRTINNYQYRYGTKFYDTFKILYKEGGILRFYKGYIPSMCLGSMCKFSELNAYYYTKQQNYNDYDGFIWDQGSLDS